MIRLRAGAIAAMGTAALLAAGCATLEPRYARPEAPVPASWPIAPTTAPGGGAAADIGWREMFIDGRLQQLLALALQNNRDLRLAALAVERSKAQYRVVRAERLPFVDARASVLRQRLPQVLSPTGRAEVVTEYSAQLGVTAWEIDFFGRVRSLSHAALERYFAQDEARRAAQLGLVGEVVRAYLALAADQELKQLAEQTLKSQEESFDLTNKRHELGDVSGLVLEQARTTVEAARVDVARYAGRLAQDTDALTLLLGGSIDPTLLPNGFDVAAMGVLPLPAGLPSDVLLRRPDVLQAEHALRAGNADLGAARAALFPTITLTGSAGVASTSLGSLFGAGTGVWSFAPQILMPIFHGGRLRAQERVASVDRDVAIAEYERAIQTAFREVADALALSETLASQSEAQSALARATRRAYELSQQRRELGQDSYLTLLDAQRAYYAAQQGLILVRLAEQSNRVTLYQVLGGGWRERSP